MQERATQARARGRGKGQSDEGQSRQGHRAPAVVECPSLFPFFPQSNRTDRAAREKKVDDGLIAAAVLVQKGFAPQRLFHLLETVREEHAVEKQHHARGLMASEVC